MNVENAIRSSPLNQVQLYGRMHNLPIPPEYIRLELERESGAGSISISDLDSQEVRIRINQTPHEWAQEKTPNEMFIFLRGPNTPMASVYLYGAKKREYEIKKGTLVFAHTGYAGNPDNLVSNDTYVEINQGRLELTIGKEINKQQINALKNWLTG